MANDCVFLDIVLDKKGLFVLISSLWATSKCSLLVLFLSCVWPSQPGHASWCTKTQWERLPLLYSLYQCLYLYMSFTQSLQSPPPPASPFPPKLVWAGTSSLCLTVMERAIDQLYVQPSVMDAQESENMLSTMWHTEKHIRHIRNICCFIPDI